MVNAFGFLGLIATIALYSGDHISSTAAWIMGILSFLAMCGENK